MIKEFLKKNEENVISFVTIFIIVIVIFIIIFIWIFNIFNSKNTGELNTYEILDYNSIITNEYIDDLNTLLKLRNVDMLYQRMDLKFMSENKLNETNFKSYLLKNNLIGNSIEIISSSVINIDEKYVIRFYYKVYDDYKYVNLIEEKPEEYTISFEQDSSKITSEMDSIYFDSNSIEFELKLIELNEDYVRYNLKITNNNNADVGIDFNDLTTFTLIGENINLPVASVVAEDIDILYTGSSINRELYFSISSEDFYKCTGIKVNNILINDEYTDVFIAF